MPILTITRHEEYRAAAPFGLCERGIVRAVMSGRQLAADFGQPGAIISSPLLRARQTAQIHAAIMAYPPLLIDDRLSEEASRETVDNLKQELAAEAVSEYVHLVTHQPVISRFCNYEFSFIKPGETLVYRLEKWRDLPKARPDGLIHRSEGWFGTHIEEDRLLAMLKNHSQMNLEDLLKLREFINPLPD